MTQDSKPTPERKKLVLVAFRPEETGERKPPAKGTWHKLTFTAKDGDNTFSYFTYSQTLIEYIKKAKAGDALDADVITSTREYQGNTYTDRQVVQIYVDDKGLSVSGTSKAPWQPRRDSPETRVSIERQCSLKCACEFCKSPVTVEQMLAVADQFYAWLRKPVQQALGSVEKPTPTSAKSEAKVPREQPESVDKDIEDLFPQRTARVPLRPDPKTSQELAQWCKDYGLTGDDIKKTLGINWSQACKEITTTVNSLKGKFPEKFPKQED